MLSMKEFVEVQLGEHTPKSQSTPVSFRCSEELIIKMDLLAKHLGFSTRSKLLSELVPIALEDAAMNLPSHLGEEFYLELEKEMNDLYEERATRDL